MCKYEDLTLLYSMCSSPSGIMWCARFQYRFYSSTVTRLAFDRFGEVNGHSKTPLIIGHGLFGSRRNWRSQAKALHKFLREDVYTIDFRNHGDSPYHDEHSYLAMAEDLSKFLNDLQKYTKVSSFNLLGHSMGGVVMSQYALNYADSSKMIAKLIIEDVAPCRPISDSAIRGYLQAMKKIDLSKSRKEIDDALKSEISSSSVRQFLMMNLVKGKEKGTKWRWQVNLDAIERGFEHVFQFTTSGQFMKSTLFIAGGNSHYIKAEDHQSLLIMFPNASFETVPNAGHWVHAEQPKLFLDVVTKFLL